MKIKSAEFLISAVGSDQYPGDDKPEIAFAGRSNVGKSSLINKLINRKNLARTSSKPGKTQTINFYDINNKFRMVDLPGYGYAPVSKTKKEQWARIIEEYLNERGNLKAIIQLVDLRHNPTELDTMMYDWLLHYEYDRIVVATKSDKISKGKKDKHLRSIANGLQIIEEDKLISFSAETGEGKDEIWKEIKKRILP